MSCSVDTSYNSVPTGGRVSKYEWKGSERSSLEDQEGAVLLEEGTVGVETRVRKKGAEATVGCGV